MFLLLSPKAILALFDFSSPLQLPATTLLGSLTSTIPCLLPSALEAINHHHTFTAAQFKSNSSIHHHKIISQPCSQLSLCSNLLQNHYPKSTMAAPIPSSTTMNHRHISRPRVHLGTQFSALLHRSSPSLNHHHLIKLLWRREEKKK